MQTIRSNPWGFRIHSPFVFNLVTKVLYGKSADADSLPPFPAFHTRKERKTGELIANLIRFLGPEEVMTCGEKNLMNEWMALQFRLGTIQEGIHRNRLPFKCCRMIINSGVHTGSHQIQIEDVWVVTCLQLKECRELWNQILTLPEVTVSVEAKSTGIVFFNPVFQKERYVVRSWVYL